MEFEACRELRENLQLLHGLKREHTCSKVQDPTTDIDIVYKGRGKPTTTQNNTKHHQTHTTRYENVFNNG